MSKVKKSVRKFSHNVMKVTSPVGYKAFGEKVFDKAEGFADKQLWDEQPEAEAALAAPEPVVMPTADDEALSKAKKRRIAQQLRRSGRQSTILTDTSGQL